MKLLPFGKMKINSHIIFLHLAIITIAATAASTTNVTNRNFRGMIRRRPTIRNNLDTNEILDTTNGKLPMQNTSYNPIVLWHGMGDTAVGIKFGLRFISNEMPGVYINSLQFGSNPTADFESGYFVNVNDQVTTACETIRNDPKLQNGYNAIGTSQGGQFLRAVAQRCPDPPMLNLISLGGQHQGIFGLPKCSAPQHSICAIVDKLLSSAAYAEWVQKFLVQAEYWHDPYKQEEYVENSVFLADINNERVRNSTYKENLQKLKNLVLVQFQNETIVQPKDSEWFGYFETGQVAKMITLEDTDLYKEDWLGLKAMNEAGKLHFLSSEGDHLQFTKPWFIENIMKPFLM